MAHFDRLLVARLWVCAQDRETSPTPGCSTDLQCSLNGACGPYGCVCDSGWHGEACELLDLLPANLSTGYNHLQDDNSSVSSWGATQLQGDEGVFHTFLGVMLGGCGINGFETNEQVVHATSASPVGPWVQQSTLAPFSASAVCPHALRDPSTGQWLIFHTGCGNHSNPASEPAPLLTDCVNGTTGPSSAPSDLRIFTSNQKSTIALSVLRLSACDSRSKGRSEDLRRGLGHHIGVRGRLATRPVVTAARKHTSNQEIYDRTFFLETDCL